MTAVAKLPPVSTITGSKFATSSACVVNTGGKFATGVNNTSSKFATGGKIATSINDTGANNRNNIRLQTPYSELEGKNLYVNSSNQRCPNKIIKIFLKLIHEKNQKSKISWYCPFKTMYRTYITHHHMYV
jgi:hypothetical protein